MEYRAIGEQRRLNDMRCGLIVGNASWEYTEAAANGGLAVSKHIQSEADTRHDDKSGSVS